MGNKGINGEGLAHLWDKITYIFATKKEVQDAIAGGGGQGGSGAVQEIFWVNIDFNFQTMTVVNIDKSYNEIINALDNNQVVKSRLTLLGLNETVYGDLFTNIKVGTLPYVGFSVFAVADMGAGTQLYHFNLAIRYDNSRNLTIRLVDTTIM